MSYKRLTEKSIGSFQYCLKNHKPKAGEFNDYDAFFDYSMAIKRLGEIEDKIENGTLVELPCAIGSTIYLVPSKTQFRLNNIGESFKKHNRVYEMEVYQIYMNKNNYVLYNYEQTASAVGSSFGETWFLTKAEAEKKLEELSKNP